MSTGDSGAPSAKASTGIPGFDALSNGGLPRGRATLLGGGAGSGKTVFALQTLVSGARDCNEPGIFVAFEEDSKRVIANAEFGDLLRRYTRPTDVVARFGGEEFVVLLSKTTLAHAVATADRIREAFAECRVAPLTDRVTASFGVAELAPGEEGEALLRRADKALYNAKDAGRNRVMAG